MAFQFWKYKYDVDNWMNVPAYRQSSFAPDTVSYWWEDASCYSSPAELFDPALEGRGNDNLSRHDVVLDVQLRMDKGHQLCNECPVWHICYQQAEPDDFFYTMRAGIEPGQFREYKKLGRMNYRSGQAKGDKETCLRGHNNWKIWGKKKPRRKCVTCDKMSPEEKREYDRRNAID